MKALIKWIVAAVVVASVLVISRDPSRWLQPSYTPRAVLKGSNQPPAPRESPVVEQLDIPSLQSAAEYAESQRSTALIVTRHGYIVFEKYWQGSNLDTVVPSEGLGRVIAALTTGVAIQERKIGWPDEPVSYILPQWAHDSRNEITVRNLLQATSGLKPDADPDVLGDVIQTASGQPYPEYASQAIWSRVGAGDASLWMGSPGGHARVDTGFRARQGDWLRIGELLLQKGNYQGDEIIVPTWVPELLKPAIGNPNYGSYLHLGTHTAPGMSPYATNDVFVVEGGGNRMWLVPSLQLAILRTGGELAGGWDEGRIPNLIIRGAHDFVPPAARPGADLRQIVPNH